MTDDSSNNDAAPLGSTIFPRVVFFLAGCLFSACAVYVFQLSADGYGQNIARLFVAVVLSAGGAICLCFALFASRKTIKSAFDRFLRHIA